MAELDDPVRFGRGSTFYTLSSFPSAHLLRDKCTSSLGTILLNDVTSMAGGARLTSFADSRYHHGNLAYVPGRPGKG